ncbi:MAG: UTP--glucose-1-phosphate uridylyltransferase [Actinobacteria bacterium]|nr:UTP--glucose-1-phosphate uridylyltransferase [Actinomycetota bacterium]
MEGLGEGVVGEVLLHLDGLAGLCELVDVGGHRCLRGSERAVLRAPNGTGVAWSFVRATTAVIPAAGLGTRFYPVTKAVPKELLPIVDVPAIQLVIDEAIAAGCDHIVVVSHPSKGPIERYLTPDATVVAKVRDSGRTEMADRLACIGTEVRVTVVHQDAPRGLGHAVGCARAAVGGNPFAVLLPDELMGDANLLVALVDSVDATGVGAVGLMRVPADEVSAYGVVTPSAASPHEGPFQIVDVVEKPRREDAPSNLIIIGRYVLTPDVFEEIDRLSPQANGEMQLTDALRSQSATSPLTGLLNRSKRWDTGTPMGWLIAVVDIALERPDVANAFGAWLRQRVDP